MADAIEKQLGKFDVSINGKSDHLTVFITSEKWKEPKKIGKIAILTAGTSDIPYAFEVEGIARIMGVNVIAFYDIGVSGIHRLVEPIKRITEEEVDVIVVLAGMEGALPTVVASLVDVPVIGLPIPTGYGYGGKGETALASMLQSCAPGLAVVNIGNGLGAGSIA
ncbi:MAG: nickel pincer cofactor biosynthesis protein LarB, partial [Candidatus Thorarchaeota archaeon]